MSVPIVCENKDQLEQAKKIAATFGIDLESGITGNQEVYLSFANGQFALESKDGLNLAISFLDDRRYHRTFQSLKKELISKACGWHLGCRNILDLTSGLAIESVFLTQVGFRVTSLERHPMLYLLLRAAQESAINKDPKGIWPQLKFVYTESAEYLDKSISLENAPDVIYYDPMYPSTTKTALPNKEMQIFRRLLGENEAEASLLELAIAKTAKLVVVKRPIKAPPLITKSRLIPNRTYLGKLIRFDVYTH